MDRSAGAATSGPDGIARHHTPVDALVLTSLIAVSVLPYLHRLGFSSDDWTLLAEMELTGSRSPLALLEAIRNPNTEPRPAQMALLVTTYWFFGTAPLGYHLVGAVLLVGAALLLQRLLVAAGAPRVVAVLVPLLWSLSPAASTDRFWYSAHGYLLASGAAYLAAWCDLRAVRGPRIAWGWKALGLVALAVSVLSFEVAVPLLAVWPLVFVTLVRRRGTPFTGPIRWMVASSYAVLAAALMYKVIFPMPGAGPVGGWVDHAERLVVSVGAVQLGSYGLLLPDSARWALTHAPGEVLVAAGLVGVVAGWYSRRLFATARMEVRSWLAVLGAGAACFVLGWAVFAGTARFTLTSTGIGNRIGIVGALGTATMSLAAVGLVTATLRVRWRATIAAAVTGGLCGTYALITLTIGDHWGRAGSRADAVADVVVDAVEDRRAATVLLTGVCPYVGPAIVFESHWDLKGLLQRRLDDPALAADVVTPRLELRDDTIRTTIYDIVVDHPYGRDTLLVSYPTGRVSPLTDRATAEEQLSASGFDPRADCPHGTEGHGVGQLRLDERFKEYRLEEEGTASR